MPEQTPVPPNIAPIAAGLADLANHLARAETEIDQIISVQQQAQAAARAAEARGRRAEERLKQGMLDPTARLKTALQACQSLEAEIGRYRRAGLERIWPDQAHLLDQLSDGILLWQMDDTIGFWSRGVEAISGWAKDEALGQSIDALLPTERPGRLATIKAAVLQQQAWAGELAITRRDGRRMVLSSRWSLHRNERGDSGAILGILSDITEQRRSQQLAERTIERMKRLQLVTNALIEAVTPAQVTQVIIDQGLPALTAAAGLVVLLDERGRLELLGSAGFPAGAAEQTGHSPVSAGTPWTEAIRSGRPIFLASLQAVRRQYPHLDTALLSGRFAWAALPLLAQTRPLGAILLAFNREGEFSGEDQDFMLALAGQAAQALERARLYTAAQAEIAARQQAEEQLETLLGEKEVLLQEVHHRVKNNLQAVSNLLQMQSTYLNDEAAYKVFRNTQDRILSIALVHEKLYQAGDIARLNVADYIQTLATHLIKTYRTNPETIRLRLDCENIPLSFHTAASFGVIVNELITNALKHAFPD